eukprot:scaffold29953_cov31-Tisochrysis_lutea.AAC.1
MQPPSSAVEARGCIPSRYAAALLGGRSTWVHTMSSPNLTPLLTAINVCTGRVFHTNALAC